MNDTEATDITLAEANTRMLEASPEHTFSIRLDINNFSHYAPRRIETQWSVFTHYPDCTIHRGERLSDAVAKAVAFLSAVEAKARLEAIDSQLVSA